MGKVVAELYEHNFGCGENHWDSEGHEARSPAMSTAIIDLDTHLLNVLRVAGGEQALNAFAMILQAQFLPVDMTMPIYRYLSNLYEALRHVGDPEVKIRVCTQAITYIKTTLLDHIAENASEPRPDPDRIRQIRLDRRYLDMFRAMMY